MPSAPAPASRRNPTATWLSLGPAARLVGVDPDTLRRWADAGQVDVFTTPGGHRRFDRHALERMRDARRPHLRPLSSLGATPERLSRSLGGPVDGTMAEYMLLPEEGVVKVPAHLTDEQAASLPCAALTAWSAVVTHDNLGPGSRVLVQGTGGVALFALQFAKLRGAHVTVISSSDEKIARAKTLGADASINYVKTPEWYKATREITAGRGYDHILELGGEKTLPQSLRCIRPGGTLSMIGVLSGGML